MKRSKIARKRSQKLQISLHSMGKFDLFYQEFFLGGDRPPPVVSPLHSYSMQKKQKKHPYTCMQSVLNVRLPLQLGHDIWLFIFFRRRNFIGTFPWKQMRYLQLHYALIPWFLPPPWLSKCQVIAKSILSSLMSMIKANVPFQMCGKLVGPSFFS